MKPDYQVRIRRQTTPSGIPPVIMVTGVKQEGKSPYIFDERLDKSVKLIVLDLRGQMDNYSSNESSASMKKLPKETLQNILQSISHVQPNQPTDCPIIASPKNTINIYANFNPKPQQQQALMQQLQQIQPNIGFMPHQNSMNMLYYNNAFNNMMIPRPSSNPLVFNQPNYLPVMASMANTVPQNYLIPGYNAMMNPHQHMISPIPQQQILTPQQQMLSSQQHMLSPPQHMLSPQQHMLSPQQQPSPLIQQQQQMQQQQSLNQIKRKPVKVQPTSYLSPQIEQRLQRKKTGQQSSQPQQLQPEQQKVSPKSAPIVKKRVTFHPKIQTFEYNKESEEEEETEENEHEYLDNGRDYRETPQYYHDEQILEEEPGHYEDDPYYTPEPSYYPPPPPPPRKYRHKSNMNYHQPQPSYYEGNEEEEDYGDLWKRRNYITRHHSKYKSRV